MKGKLSISNPRDGKGAWINIQLEDAKSGMEFISIDISYEAFARALFQHDQDCEFELRNLDLIGKRRETKTEQVFIPKHEFANREKVAAEAVAQFEIDGWKGRVEDALNFHKCTGRGSSGWFYEVFYVRFVDESNYKGENDK